MHNLLSHLSLLNSAVMLSISLNLFACCRIHKLRRWGADDKSTPHCEGLGRWDTPGGRRGPTCFE